jgi:hypothetical protein
MTAENELSRDRIRALNDAFRRSFVGGTVVVTAGFESLPPDWRRLILAKIRAFDNFDEGNDPHGEHDFGLIEDGDVPCFWKIDYYDTDMELISTDPTDASVTTQERVRQDARRARRLLGPILRRDGRRKRRTQSTRADRGASDR